MNQSFLANCNMFTLYRIINLVSKFKSASCGKNTNTPLIVTKVIIKAKTTPSRMKNKFAFLFNEVHVWFKVACQLLPTAEYDEVEKKTRFKYLTVGIVSMHACKRKTSANTKAPHSRPRLFSICSVQFY